MDKHFIKIMVLISAALSIKYGLECTDVSLCIILFLDCRISDQSSLFTGIFRVLLSMFLSMMSSMFCSTA